MEDGVNFVIYKRSNLKEEARQKMADVKIADVVRQLGPTGSIEEKSDDVVVIRGTTNFDAARIKKVVGDYYKVESFLQDHPLVNGISNKPPRAY